MRISFVLPCSGRYPIGGFRIVYEYANRLADRGHQVSIVHFAAFPALMPPKRLIRAAGQWVRDRIPGGYLTQSRGAEEGRGGAAGCVTGRSRRVRAQIKQKKSEKT